MVKVDWSDEAKFEFRTYVKNARLEFGVSTCRRWLKERKDVEWRLKRYPTSYPPEPLLQGRDILYRCGHLMNRRFKIIYYYDEAEDIARIVDIWDTKMNPKALIWRIK